MERKILGRMVLPPEINEIVDSKTNIIIPESRQHLFELSMGSKENNFFEIAYDIPEGNRFLEATVAKCKMVWL